MTGFNAQPRGIAQGGGVFTPPALRSRGYARAAVAGSLKRVVVTVPRSGTELPSPAP
jgi:predicted GNAT family acetyltransferase